jgi:hypothetical protein
VRNSSSSSKSKKKFLALLQEEKEDKKNSRQMRTFAKSLAKARRRSKFSLLKFSQCHNFRKKISSIYTTSPKASIYRCRKSLKNFSASHTTFKANKFHFIPPTTDEKKNFMKFTAE